LSKTYFTYLFSAARTALSNPRQAELIQRIGTGPSIRARVRLALVAAFLVAAPTLFIGVMQTDSVSRYAKTLNEKDLFWQKIGSVRLAIEIVRSAIWRYEIEPEIENERMLLQNVQNLRTQLFSLYAKKPEDIESGLSFQIGDISIKLENSVLYGLRRSDVTQERLSKESMHMAHLTLTTLVHDLQNLEKQVEKVVGPSRQAAIGALSLVGRNQLVLFLILLFAFPIFIGFVPGWVVTPLTRLKGIEQRIEQGRVRDLEVSGRDEISQLARTLRSALVLREELDQRKSAKIFEVRNVLRAVINHVVEPILIVDKVGRINYANEAAAQLFGVGVHHLEGHGMQEHIFSPELERAFGKARQGHVVEDGFRVTLEVKSGSVQTLLAHLSAIHERQGGISRVVLVLSSL
jgi:PAS domain S-box-containing protein